MKDLEIKLTKGKGRGVFTKTGFDLNETIEVCPLIILPEEQKEELDKTELYNYYFELEEGSVAIALGYGSLYNHSNRKPNAKYILDKENQNLIIKSIRRAKPGEEVTINYNGKPKDSSKVWFES